MSEEEKKNEAIVAKLKTRGLSAVILQNNVVCHYIGEQEERLVAAVRAEKDPDFQHVQWLREQHAGMDYSHSSCKVTHLKPPSCSIL